WPASPTTGPTRARAPGRRRWPGSSWPGSGAGGRRAATELRIRGRATPSRRSSRPTRSEPRPRPRSRSPRPRPRVAQLPDPLTPVLTDTGDAERSWTLRTYEQHGGYEALPKALRMKPDDVIELVKNSGLRGRGGAGFPTGMKWGFIPKDNPKSKYLVVNADESEPGTCKDIPLMMASPHALVERVIIASYAIGANTAFIYVRGEVLHVIRRLHKAVQEAYRAGYLGKNIHGSGFDLDVIVHAGAGAYICGEETALLDSLEGQRGQPRLRPPFPAVAGLY